MLIVDLVEVDPLQWCKCHYPFMTYTYMLIHVSKQRHFLLKRSNVTSTPAWRRRLIQSVEKSWQLLCLSRVVTEDNMHHFLRYWTTPSTTWHLSSHYIHVPLTILQQELAVNAIKFWNAPTNSSRDNLMVITTALLLLLMIHIYIEGFTRNIADYIVWYLV